MQRALKGRRKGRVPRAAYHLGRSSANRSWSISTRGTLLAPWMQPRELEHRAASSRSGLDVTRMHVYRNETDREDARNKRHRAGSREKETHPLDREPPGLCNAEIPATCGVTRRIPFGLRRRFPASPVCAVSVVSVSLLSASPLASSFFDRGYLNEQPSLIDARAPKRPAGDRDADRMIARCQWTLPFDLTLEEGETASGLFLFSGYSTWQFV